MTLHVPSLPFSLDPLMAEAKRRARQRRVLVALGALFLAALALGLTLALRSPGRAPTGGLASARYPRYGVSFRYPSGLTAVRRCGGWAFLGQGYGLEALALITSNRGVMSNCSPADQSPIPPIWPPLVRLDPNGVSIALGWVETSPDVRLAAVPTDYTGFRVEQHPGWPFGCPPGVGHETRSVAIGSGHGPEGVSVDALICGPRFATGRAAFRQIVRSLRIAR